MKTMYSQKGVSAKGSKSGGGTRKPVMAGKANSGAVPGKVSKGK